MTAPAERYPFLPRDPSLGAASLVPLLPITLLHGKKSVAVMGWLDTGAAVNVLPYPVGEQMGADWDQQTTAMELSGNLAAVEARVLVVTAVVGSYPPVRLG